MASLHSQITIILFILFAFSPFQPSESCGIAVYWSPPQVYSLQETCSTGLYSHVIIGFLNTFGGGQTPGLNLRPYCNPSSGSCEVLRPEILACQKLGVKVLLSLGGSDGIYGLSSKEDAKDVANYLYTNFLAGNLKGPFGEVALDGIDFDIENPTSKFYWDNLARALAAFSTPKRKILLSAAPQCHYPDRYLDAAIKTGLFDYVWVKFYNNQQCDFTTGGNSIIIQSWNQWRLLPSKGTKLSMGLLASPQAGQGFIPVNTLSEQILPVIRKTENYGGVMLFNRNYDVRSEYGSQIFSAVCDANLMLPSEGLYSNQ